MVARPPFLRHAWLGKLTLALAVPAILAALLELGLRAGGYGRNPDFFIPDTAPGVYRTNPRFTETYFPASFGLKPANFRITREKPTGTVRIFVLGESAAMGVPEPGFGLAPMLRTQLRALHPGTKIEVCNLGITAINSHVIRDIAREAVRFHPDLLVVYMGNNEVVGPYGPGSSLSGRVLPRPLIAAGIALRRSRIGQLLQRVLATLHPGDAGVAEWRGMETFADNQVAASDPRLGRVDANFAANLRDIVRAAQSAGVKVVLSTVAVNLRDSAPFASRHRAGLGAAELAKWTSVSAAADTAADLDDPAAAERLEREALALDPDFAETQFKLARLLDARGEEAGARAAFAEALRLDALRFRADATINDLIRSVARETQADLVDAARELGADPASTAPIAGHPLFFEHVHFTFRGNFELARVLVPAADRLLFGETALPATPADEGACAAALGYSYLGRMAQERHMQELTSRPPFTGQYTFGADRARLDREIQTSQAVLENPAKLQAAIAVIEAAHRRDPADPFLCFHAAAAALQGGDPARALEANDSLQQLEPSSPEDAAQRAFILAQLQRTDEAEALLRESARTDPNYFQTYDLLAELWLSQHQTARARDYFADLVARLPGISGARLTYARVLDADGNQPAAEEQWRAVLRRHPDNDPAVAAMVERMWQRGDQPGALDLMLRAHAANPRDFANNARLEQVYEARGDTENTIQFLRAMADSGPVRPELHLDLATLLGRAGRNAEMKVELHRARRAAHEVDDAEVFRRAEDALAAAGN